MFVKTVFIAFERFDSAPVKQMHGPMSFVCHEMFATRYKAEKQLFNTHGIFQQLVEEPTMRVGLSSSLLWVLGVEG